MAEELLLGGGSHGAVSDLEKAATIAAAMIGSFGLAGPDHLAYLGPPGDARSFLALDDIRSRVNKEMAEASSACRSLLEANRGALEKVAATLFERGRIDGKGVVALLRDRGLTDTRHQLTSSRSHPNRLPPKDSKPINLRTKL